MSQMVPKLIRWVSIPVLLIAGVFACLTARYETLLDSVLCLGALLSMQRAFRRKEYFWAAAFVALVIVFSPLLLVDKVFFLIGITCAVTFLTVLAGFRAQPVAVEIL